MIFIGIFIFAFLMWRAVLPLKCRPALKAAAGAAAFIAAFKFKIIQIFGGHYFAPDLPREVILLSAWVFVTVFIFMFLMVIGDTFLFGVTCGEALHTLLKTKKCDAKKLLRQHPLLNKVHAAELAAAAVVAVFGMVNGLALPQVRHLTVTSPDLPPEADGKTVAVLTDLHVDNINDRKKMEKIVQLTNELHPDIVCLLGDFSDGVKKRHLDALEALTELRPKYGVYGVVGNHEYYSGYRILTDHFAALGIPLLFNENRLIPRLKLRICGVTDSQAARFNETPSDPEKALACPEKDSWKILLCHRPRGAREHAALGADLQLSGHTHGGMVIGFDRIVAALNDGFVRGSYKVGDMHLEVSSGTCLWNGFPVRIGCRSEILLITLKRPAAGTGPRISTPPSSSSSDSPEIIRGEQEADVLCRDLPSLLNA
ncbi:MAG: metallophosphoesterase [Lentisphaeria bacterium]|nr:metallophosphoesterase [Lentisphaeria bacterium]